MQQHVADQWCPLGVPAERPQRRGHLRAEGEVPGAGHGVREVVGHEVVEQSLGSRDAVAALVGSAQLEQRRRVRADGGPVTGDEDVGVDPARFARVPARQAAQQHLQLLGHLVLADRPDVVEQALQLQPVLVDAGDVPRRPPRRGHGRLVVVGLGRDAAGEGRSHAVDQLVGDPRGDQLAPQAVLPQLFGEPRDEQVGHVDVQHRLQGPAVGQARGQQLALEPPLGVAEQRGVLRSGETGALRLAFPQLVGPGQDLHRAVEVVVLLEHVQQECHVDEPARPLQQISRDAPDLEVDVPQDVGNDVLGDRDQQPVALGVVDQAVADRRLEQDLDVDLVVGAVDPTDVVDRVLVHAAASPGVADARRLRHREVGALADDAGTHLVGVDAHLVVGAVPDVPVALVGILDVRADAAEPQQVDLGPQDRPHQRRGCQLLGVDLQYRTDLVGQPDRLLVTADDHAPRRQHRAVVVLPRGPRRVEQPLSLGERRHGVRVGVDEHVTVVEGGQQPDRARPEHAVAEHVTGHVAHADDRDRLLLRVDPELEQVPPHGDPRTAGGDAQRLVVVALGAAAGERVTEPEPATQRDRVGDVGEGRRPLVGRDDEVGVVAVPATHPGWRDHLAVPQVVGDAQERLDEHLVLAPDLRTQLVGVVGWAAQDEAPLGARGDDHRVLEHLGLHQAEHLGAHVVLPVRPAQATTGHRAPPQVDALDARTEHEDLAVGHGRRHPRHP